MDNQEEQYNPLEDCYYNIEAAYGAIASIDGMDGEIMTKQEASQIKQIKKMSLRIIYESIKMIHDDLFSEEEED